MPTEFKGTIEPDRRDELMVPARELLAIALRQSKQLADDQADARGVDLAIQAVIGAAMARDIKPAEVAGAFAGSLGLWSTLYPESKGIIDAIGQQALRIAVEVRTFKGESTATAETGCGVCQHDFARIPSWAAGSCPACGFGATRG